MEIPLSEPQSEKRDFFISYSKADIAWARWITWQLEEAGYTTYFQEWDFRAGSNFVHEMDKADKQADRTIIVLSPNFIKSEFTASEWYARYKEDPTGERRKLVPVRVAEYEPVGFLGQIIYIDLVGKNEKEAKEKLINEIRSERPKPPNQPAFPHTLQDQPSFPPDLPQTENIEASDSWKPAVWAIISVVGVFLIGWFIFYVISDNNYRASPEYALTQFCNAMKYHEYDTAYTYFEDSQISHVTKSQFLARIDAVANPRDSIGDCTFRIVNQIGTIAHAKIIFNFGDGSNQTGQYELYQQTDGYWLISRWSF
jgi:TIR domain